jgi:hypothetical protein
MDRELTDRELGLDQVGGEVAQTRVETSREKPVDAVHAHARHRGQDDAVGQLRDRPGRRAERDVPDLGEGR